MTAVRRYRIMWRLASWPESMSTEEFSIIAYDAADAIAQARLVQPKSARRFSGRYDRDSGVDLMQIIAVEPDPGAA